MSVEPVRVKSEYKLVTVLSDGGAGYRVNHTMRMVQDWSYDQNITPENVREIGNDQIVSTVYDPVTCDASINTLISEFSFADLAAVIGAAGGSASFDEVEFDNAICDVMIKGSVDGTTMNNTLLIPYCFLTSLDISLTVDGLATMGYRLAGGMDESFINELKDAEGEVLGTGVFTTDTVWTSVTSATGHTPIYLYVDGVKYSAVGGLTEFTWTTTSVTLTGIDASGAVHVLLVFANTTPAAFSMITLSGDEVGAFKGKTITLSLAYDAEPGASDKLLRAQGATLSAPLNRSGLKEMGTENNIFQDLAKPLEMTVSLDFLESDMRRYATEIAGKTFATDDYLNPDMFLTRQKLQFKAEIKDEDAALHLEIIMSNMRVTGHGRNVTVGGQAMVRWQFTGSALDFANA